MKEDKFHKPVLVKEVLQEFGRLSGKKVIDATLGTGGHAQALIEAGVEVLGIEADPKMLEIAKKRLGAKCRLVQGNFRKIDEIAKQNGFAQVDGILFDLGVSNLQLTCQERGFSFANPKAFLDMRINKTNQAITGSDLLNGLRPDQLEELYKTVLDISTSRWLVKRTVAGRIKKPISSVGDFLEICRGLKGKPGLNPATLPFLALRIAVNSELDNLTEALPKALALLTKRGKILVITFHSKEEEIVRSFDKELIGPIQPSWEEIQANPRSRSAELFVLTKK